MGAPEQASRHMSREARREFYAENLGHFRQVQCRPSEVCEEQLFVLIKERSKNVSGFAHDSSANLATAIK